MLFTLIDLRTNLLTKTNNVMSVLKIALSIGAGILATAACYLCISSSEQNNINSSNKNQEASTENLQCNTASTSKTSNLVKKLDKFQVCVLNAARFTSDVVRSITLFIRAINCYEYDANINMNYR